MNFFYSIIDVLGFFFGMDAIPSIKKAPNFQDKIINSGDSRVYISQDKKPGQLISY